LRRFNLVAAAAHPALIQLACMKCKSWVEGVRQRVEESAAREAVLEDQLRRARRQDAGVVAEAVDRGGDG
jgi:hypothetical protein